MIFQSGFVTATTTDLLNGTRLSNIPYNGSLTCQFGATNLSAGNNFALTIQLPNGDVPVDAQPLLLGNETGVNGLDDRWLSQFTFQAPQGGHFTIQLTLTGVAVAMFRIALAP